MQPSLPANPLRNWGICDEKPLLIAGPCSAESREQVLATAKALSDSKVHVLRAGVWKPRTRPGSFEGVGEEALGWLKDAHDETGLLTGTEVAQPEHVELALKYGIDVLWIGARTTVNPFSVQALADALKGVDVPVFVKNPVSPDIALWVGALERIAAAGITRLGAIHRGFSIPSEDGYRNTPEWRLPVELMMLAPDLPLICDPSHICGVRDKIPAVCQEAMDLLFDGLMIEVHPDPDTALSDAKQQLTPESYSEVVNALLLPHKELDRADVQEHVTSLRQEIDSVDADIIRLFARRMGVVRQIRQWKRKSNVSVLQPDRWRELLQDRIQQGRAQGLSRHFLKSVYDEVHEEAIRQQEEME